MVESIGELVVALLETVGWVVDLGPRPPRAGHRYRVRQHIDAVGQVLTTSEEGAAFEACLAPGTVFRIVNEPAPDSSDVSILPENGLMDGVVPRIYRAAAMAAGYQLQVPTVLLASHCKRISGAGNDGTQRTTAK